MKKILVTITILISSIFANNFEQNMVILEELNLPKEFLNEQSFKLKYKELSTTKKIQYYDNLIKKSSLNAKIVKEELELKNLPKVLFFLPLIESSFKNLVNKNGPSGLWQIMPLTASNLKLKRNEFVDERLDLIKSTDAATNYLRRYYKKFGKWYLSVLAYNAGEGRIIHGVARATLDKYLDEHPTMYHDKVIKIYNLYIADYTKNKKGIDNLYTIYKDLGLKSGHFDYLYLLKHNSKRDYLPKTSVNYINMLVSFAILENSDRFKNLDKKTKYDLEKVNANKGLRLKTIADELSMSYEELKTINKHLLKEMVPADKNSYNFYIPHTKVELFNNKISNMKELAVTENKATLEKVKNDTNNKSSFDANKNSKDLTTNKIIHKVKQGDTLEAIAKKYKVSVKKLKIDNKKSSSKLKIGENIEIIK